MVLKDISDWLLLVKTYWTTEINNSIYTNKSALKTTMEGFLTDLQTKYDSYITGSSKASMADFLMPINGYITMKFALNFPSVTPPITVVIPDEDARTFYVNWSYTLPSDYSTMFDLHAVLEPSTSGTSGTDGTSGTGGTSGTSSTGEGEILKGATYTTVETTITTGNATDSALLEGFKVTLSTGLMERSLYLTNAKPTTITPVVGFNSKNQQLIVMNLMEIFRLFNWTFVGLFDGDWVLGTAYGQGQVLYRTTSVYDCLLDHTASSDNEPGLDLYDDWGIGNDYIIGDTKYGSDDLVYRCIKNNTSAATNEPGVTDPNIENWALDKYYYGVTDVSVVYSGVGVYTCKLNHKATALTEPGVGTNWSTCWNFSRYKWSYYWVLVGNGWKIYWSLIG